MEGLVPYPDGRFKLEKIRKLEIGKNPFAPNDVLIEGAYCRMCGGYAHKWKDTDRKDSKGPSKAVVSRDEKVCLKLAREFGADAVVEGEKKDLFVVVKK
jgi:D-arabinose 1-dehydrogenase-like Zn-dependent alcohol dehydrogenase